MEAILEFIKTMGVTQWAGVALIAAAAWFGRGYIASLFGSKATTTKTKQPDVSAEQAFQAVNTLIDHFQQVKCEPGLAAAREAGRHLFDQPGEHA